MSTTTTGVGCISRINITSSAVTLVLIGASQALTYQITAEATDNFGTVIPDVELYYNIVAGNDVAEVSDSGLVTATGAGQALVQVSAAAFGNTINLFTPDGIPINAVYSEQAVSIENGVPITPDFSFTLDSDTYTVDSDGSVTVTITQTALHGFTGTVGYVVRSNWSSNALYQPNWPHPALGYQAPANVAATYSKDGITGPSGYITGGSGTCTITLTATDAPAGTLPLIVNGFYPIWSAIGAEAGGPVRSHNIEATLIVS